MRDLIQIYAEAMLVCIVAVFLAALLACGDDSSSAPEPLPANADDRLVAEECGRCHNGSQPPRIRAVADLQSQAGASRLITSGRMPPDRRLAAGVKSKLLSLAE